MAKARKSALDSLGQYQHEKQQRLNNPPVSLVAPSTDIDGLSRIYEYDPHLNPQLVLTGKADNASFDLHDENPLIRTAVEFTSCKRIVFNL